MTGILSGVDIVEIARIQSLDPAIRTRFLERVFTPYELVDCKEDFSCLAGRFAVKEATAKALGSGIGQVSWQDIETRINESSQPVLVLHGGAESLAEKQGWSSVSISISHTAGIAIATVTVLTRDG